MSIPERHVAQYQAHDYLPVKLEDRKDESTAMKNAFVTKHNNYKPRELRTPFLVAFSVFTLIIFVLLQISTSAFVGAPGVQKLVQRSVGSSVLSSSSSSSSASPSASASYAPNPNFYANTKPRSSSSVLAPEPTATEPTQLQGAPRPGSYSASFGTGFNNTVNTASLSTISRWSQGYYFAGGYLPTLIAIVLGIWWKCIFARLKEMEPFYQITDANGATIEPSLLLSYSSATLPKVLYQSFFSEHWSSFLGSVNIVFVTLCTLFASETMFLTSVGDTCHDILSEDSNDSEGCSIVLAMRPALGWTLGGILFIVFVMTVCVIMRLRRRRSGIYADPTTIAGIACLLSNDSEGISTQAFHDESRSQLLASPGNPRPYLVDQLTYTTRRPSNSDRQTRAPSRKRHADIAVHPAALSAFCLFLLGLLIMTLYYRFVSMPGTGNALEDFMNSQSFGVRFFMTALGLSIKFYWGWVETYVRRIRPYDALVSPEGASAAKSVLLSSPSHPATALFYRETWSHVLLAVATLMAVLSEALIIALSGIPYSPALLYLAFELSVYISMGILALMIVSTVMVLVWTMTGKNQRGLPDIPESIADVLELLGDEDARKALSGLYRYESDKGSQSQVRFALRKQAGSRAWCIKIWAPSSPSLEY